MTEDPTETVTYVSILCFCLKKFLSVFLFPSCFPTDPLLHLEYLLLLMEQREKSLETHTRLFWVLASLTNYPDDALCVFYDASFNFMYRAPSSKDGPLVNFTTFVEWTMVRNGSPFPAGSRELIASATTDQEPSPPSPREPALSQATEQRISPEVEPNPSDQVRELATEPTTT